MDEFQADRAAADREERFVDVVAAFVADAEASDGQVLRGRADSVGYFVNSSRTQNGHIRNDTRDVSRRISTDRNGPICRRRCVASDRACGKE